MSFSIHSIYRQIFRVWRRKRFKIFLRLVQPSRQETLLDIGGYPGSWTWHEPVVGSIDSLNIHPVSFDATAHPEHKIRTLVGDGCKLGFADYSYDVAFSNSVIEHVGSWENQQRFARELSRVGRKIWCQTPARECPLEPHYLAPFVHWLPKPVQRRIVRWLTPWGWLARPTPGVVQAMVETTRLISRKEMSVLFPGCHIHVEYLLPFIPKSYVAVRGAADAPRQPAWATQPAARGAGLQ
jgi:hypothetical protein